MPGGRQYRNRSGRDGGDVRAPDQWNVLELSSFQLETIETFRATIAVCLNVTQNHLDRHHTFENYANAKARVVRDAGSGTTLRCSMPMIRLTLSFAQRTQAKTVWFSGTHRVSGAWLDGDVIHLDG